MSTLLQVGNDWASFLGGPPTIVLNGVMGPHYKMPYNWVTGVITPVRGVITIFITARCTSGTDQNLNRCYEIHLASGSRAVSLAGTTVYTLDVSCRDWVVISVIPVA